jgi:hypothetical protein
MTAASYTSRSFAPSARSVRLRHVLAALGVCLPVPICAASGLSLPLPATVERIAAALVPWVDAVAMSANEALRPGAAGSIVPVSSEHGADRTATFVADVTVRSRHRKGVVRIVVPRPVAAVRPLRGETATVASTPSAELASASAARDAAAAPPVTQVADAGAQPQPAAAPEPTPSPSGATDNGAPAPAPPTATTPSEPQPAPPTTTSDPDPVAEAVSEVTAPLVPVVETTTTTVEETVAPVTELLPGLGK